MPVKDQSPDDLNRELKKELQRKGFLDASFNVIDSEVKNCAKYLHEHAGRINQEALGEFLGEGPKGKNGARYLAILNEYANQFEFKDKDFMSAAREFLGKFKLPGEAQKIERIMEAFAHSYFEKNEGKDGFPFQKQDDVFILAFAIIMLNTDLHNPSIKNKMKVEAFQNQLKENIQDKEFIKQVYNDIKDNKFVLPTGGKKTKVEVGPATSDDFIKNVKSKTISQRYQEADVKKKIFGRAGFTQAKSRKDEIKSVQDSVNKLEQEYKTSNNDPEAIHNALTVYLKELKDMEDKLSKQKGRMGESRLLKVVQDLKKEALPQLAKATVNADVKAQAKRESVKGEDDVRTTLKKSSENAAMRKSLGVTNQDLERAEQKLGKLDTTKRRHTMSFSGKSKDKQPKANVSKTEHPGKKSKINKKK
ncbi:MAG: hypothetical protein HYX61_11120 [Gammaproteobacteria bacterium]|nr:hypothetical protein [Gammaproteobacteria bacterium]